jgi:hypothetical protein
LPLAFASCSLTATWCPTQVPRSKFAHKVAQIFFSRFFQAQKLFSENLFKKENGYKNSSMQMHCWKKLNMHFE